MKFSDVWISAPILLALFIMVAGGGGSREPANASLQTGEQAKRQAKNLSEVAEKLRAVLAKLPAFQGAQVVATDHELQITVQSNSIFSLGTADTVSGADEQIKAVASLLKMSEKPLQIFVEGHTDASPVVRNRWRYPSNWELSGSRALHMVRLFEEAGIPGERLGGAGFAATRPVGTTDDENRRIVIKIQ